MAMDFLQKDLIPKTASPSFRDENGVKIVYGSGLDITADDYAKMEHDPGAETALKTFLASSSMNFGGKTGEGQKRPTGAYYLSAIAANDANKVAMTWELDPTWVKDHAGTKDAHGPTWDLQEKLSAGGDEALKSAQITFFMDANKAQSGPFKAMQMSTDEMLMNLDGSIGINNFKDAGQVTLSKNALGGYSYNGYVQAIDALGNVLNNPIFGTTDSDLNGVTSYFNDMLSQISMSNINQLNAIRQNTVTDPNELLQE
jgi:hypothetical protein